MTRAGLPLHRILEQPRRARRSCWQRHGRDTLWFFIVVGAVIAVMYAEWWGPWIREAVQ